VGKTVDVLVQVNVSGEKSKFHAESVRYVFSKLRDLSIDIGKEKFDNSNMEILSMGMSNDFEIAIEEGANMVRIGTELKF